jgi:hypothetical protein
MRESMPQIPLIPGTNLLPNLPAPVLDRERRPTVDNSGVIEAVGRLAKSGAQPMVPDSLAAPYKALGAVGEAVAQAGDVMSAIAVQHQKNRDTIAIRNAEDKRDAAFAEFSLAREKEPDPSKWSDLFDTYAQKATSEIGKEKMSNRAKVEVERRNHRWVNLTRIEVARASVSKTADRARQINEDGLELAIQTQNSERFEAELTEAISNLRINENLAGRYRERYKQVGEQQALEQKAKVFKGALSTATDFAVKNGVDLALRNIDGNAFGDFDAEQKLVLAETVRRAGRDQTSRVMESVMNGIAKGDSEADLKLKVQGNPHVSDALFSQMNEERKRWTLATQANADAEDRRVNGTKNSVELFDRIQHAQPTGDETKDKADFFTLASEIRRRVPEESSGLLNQVLYQKYWQKPMELQPREEVMKYFHERVGGLFGPTGGRIPYRREGSKEVSYRDPQTGVTVTQREDTSVEDPEKRERALAEKTRVIIALNDAAKKHPQDFQKIETAEKHYLEALPEGRLGAALEDLRRSLPWQQQRRQPQLGGPPQASAPGGNGRSIGTVTSFGYANDSTPDRNSSLGIGAFTTEEDAKGDRSAPTRLRPGDVAVSPDIEHMLRSAGVRPRDKFLVELENGEKRLVRWIDRTANDEEIAVINAKRRKERPQLLPLMRGRIDFYAPSGKHRYDGLRVVDWSVAKPAAGGTSREDES